MLKILLFTTLLTTLFATAHESTPQIDFMAETNPELNAALNSYERLYSYLLNQDDLEIQLSIPTFSYRKITKEYTKAYKNVLKQAIDLSSSPFVIYRADTICHAYSSLTEWCHDQNIHETHKKIDPNNMMTYLLSLHSNDPNNKQILIDAAINSTYSNTFHHHNTIELSKHIQAYINDTPEFLDDNNETEIDNGLKKIAFQQFINKGLATKEELLSQDKKLNTNILSLTIGMYMANALPNYNSELYKTCQNNESQEDCLTIAEILNKDTSIYNQNLARRMLKYQYEQLNFNEEIVKIKLQGKILYEKMNCYLAPDVIIITMINEEAAKLHIKNFKEFGELQALKLLAFKVYNIEKEHGFNPAFNPNDC